MPRSHPPYPPEFRSGERTAEELARDLWCSAQAIRNWVRQVDLDEGRRSDSLTTAEHEELDRRTVSGHVEESCARSVPGTASKSPSGPWSRACAPRDCAS